MNRNHESNKLTFGSFLRTLRSLSANQIRNQVELYQAVFSSYCKEAYGSNWEPCQGSISRLMCDYQKPSWNHRNWYLNVDQCNIRTDVKQYLQRVVTTAKLRRLHLEQLETLVAGSTNIDIQDRDYILAYAEAGEEVALEELMCRILVVLYNEPLNSAHK